MRFLVPLRVVTVQSSCGAVFFGRDAEFVLGLDDLRGMRTSGFECLFVILGPSGVGKSSFLRAGLLPRLRRDDRNFVPLPIVRPERAVLSGERGLAHAIQDLRVSLELDEPMLGEIKNACDSGRVEQLRGWLEEARQVARARLLDVPADQPQIRRRRRSHRGRVPVDDIARHRCPCRPSPRPRSRSSSTYH
jgi:hypothetical protein